MRRVAIDETASPATPHIQEAANTAPVKTSGSQREASSPALRAIFRNSSDARTAAAPRIMRNAHGGAQMMVAARIGIAASATNSLLARIVYRRSAVTRPASCPPG